MPVPKVSVLKRELTVSFVFALTKMFNSACEPNTLLSESTVLQD